MQKGSNVSEKRRPEIVINIKQQQTKNIKIELFRYDNNLRVRFNGKWANAQQDSKKYNMKGFVSFQKLSESIINTLIKKWNNNKTSSSGAA